MAQPQTRVLLTNFYISVGLSLVTYISAVMMITLSYVTPIHPLFFVVKSLTNPFVVGMLFLTLAFVFTFFLNVPSKPFYVYGQSRRARQG